MVSNSQDFFINIPKKDIPYWDRSKAYYEQSTDAVQFFMVEWEKITKGLFIGGVFVHPWLYFHCNFFMTPIPQPDGREKIVNPPLRDNEWFMAEYYGLAEEKRRGILMYGSRRWAKSSCEASILLWNAITKGNTVSEIICGDTDDLTVIAKFLEVAVSNMHPAFLLPTNKQNWSKHIQFGIKEGGTETNIAYSDIRIKNANAGKESSSEKGAGGAPICAIYDEIGKYSFKEIYTSMLPAIKTPYGLKAVVLLSGTSGNEKLSKDAADFLSDPERQFLLPMQWDLLESKIDPEHVTWKRKIFGMFTAPQMSFGEEGLIKLEKGLGDYVKSKDKEANKIKIQVTDWKVANEIFYSQIKKLETNKYELLKYKMYYPLDPEWCFGGGSMSPFPVTEAKLHLQRLKETGDLGKDVDLFKKEDGKVGYKLSDKKRVKFPFDGGVHNAPAVLYGDLPDYLPEYGEFVSGLDDYKQKESTGDSVGAFYVLERSTSFDVPLEIIRMSYASRPTTQEMFYRQSEMGIDAFNAQCFVENADQGFIAYLLQKHRAEQLLAEGIEWSKAQNPNSKATKKFGYHPTIKNSEVIFSLVVSYCWEEIIIGQDENGENIVKLGVEFIPDPDLLQEIIDWKKGVNVDRIVAFGSALAWARYLDKLNIVPRKENTNVKEQREKQKNARQLNRGYIPLKKIRK